jgi:hypothetical protein
MKRILLGWRFWELNLEVLVSLWLKASAIWGRGEREGLRPLWLETGRSPFELYPGICLTTEEKHGQPGSPGTARCADLAVFWGTASAGLLDVRSPRFPRWLQSALGRHRCLPSYRTKGFPASADFESKLSVRALMWSAKNGIPKSSWICLLPTYHGALVAMRRHVNCSTCSFLTWLLAADLQIGHA